MDKEISTEEEELIKIRLAFTELIKSDAWIYLKEYLDINIANFEEWILNGEVLDNSKLNIYIGQRLGLKLFLDYIQNMISTEASASL